MVINRYLEAFIRKDIGKQKAILIFGTRRTGKSTLIKKIAKINEEQTLVLQGEDLSVHEILQNRTIANYQNLLRGKSLLIIDEAQDIPDIGKVLKLMIDHIESLTILATGSSSFDLQKSSGEPLVGRKIEYQLYPIAQCELQLSENILETKNNLENRLIYGSYPELWHLESDEEREIYQKQIIESYLLKDILMYENVKGSKVLYQLLQLLAWQTGSMVSTVELSNALQINKITVERYLDLLSKVYIIFPLSGFSRNLRKEITKSKKWYFFDNGIRNALIGNFNRIVARNDIGQLWEQYILSERIKYNSSQKYYPNYYFWRTYDGQEIDLIEIDNKQNINSLECKWNSDKAKIPVAFEKAYPEATFSVIHQQNYLEFIT